MLDSEIERKYKKAQTEFLEVEAICQKWKVHSYGVINSILDIVEENRKPEDKAIEIKQEKD